MCRHVVNAIMGFALLSLVALNVGGRRDYRRPNWEVAPNMADPVAYESYSVNPSFPDGKTLQAPPPGTIARGMAPLPYDASPESATRAGKELVSPFVPTDAAALERGAKIYRRFCLPCHGPTGQGDGAVAQRGFPPPPSLLADRAVAMPDGQMFHVVTYGQGNMPSHAAQVPADDRWRAVLHVRRLQDPAPVPDERP